MKIAVYHNLGCLPEIVGNDAGIIYDPDSPHGLVAVIQEMMKSDRIAMGAAAWRRAASFAWPDLAEKTKEIYTG